VFVAESLWSESTVLYGGLGRLMSSVKRERMVNKLDSGASLMSLSGGERRGTAVLGFRQKLISLSSFPFFVFLVHSLR
jgi:hypothetical protein